MTTHRLITRGDFLRCAGTVALLTGFPQARAAAQTKDGFESDLALELAAAPRHVQLRAGPATRVWAYRARVLKGNPASVQERSDSYLGPTLRTHRGQKLHIDFVNRLDEPSIINWRGLHVPRTHDGCHAMRLHHANGTATNSRCVIAQALTGITRWPLTTRLSRCISDLPGRCWSATMKSRPCPCRVVNMMCRSHQLDMALNDLRHQPLHSSNTYRGDLMQHFGTTSSVYSARLVVSARPGFHTRGQRLGSP